MPKKQKAPPQMPMFVVTEFLHGFHKTIRGTTRSGKIQFLIQQIFIEMLGVLSVKRRQSTFLYYQRKVVTIPIPQRALNIIIPTNTLVLLIKAIKN